MSDVEQLYRRHAGRLLGSLVRQFSSLDIAEDALHEAVALAIERWAADGEPRHPDAWLLTVARRKALDRVRRERLRPDKELRAAGVARTAAGVDEMEFDASEISDDQLRLIFMCCHPALARDAQVALTLRSVCGLTTAELARAFLVEEPTMAQRLVRAKHKIRTAGIPFARPSEEMWPERLDQVLHVVYLVFNEGYAASSGTTLVRHELCDEAIRLGRTLAALLPNEPEVLGLLALILLHDSRRATRVDAAGDLVLLADQDRSRWDHDQIAEGEQLVEHALRLRQIGSYQVEAAIAALHATSPHPDATDWPQIVSLYGVLASISPSPVVALNRAAAVSMADGPDAGLAALQVIHGLEKHHLFHSAQADMLRRVGRVADAVVAYEEALRWVATESERRFLVRQRDALAS